MTAANLEPQVSRYGIVDMQVCVPADWTDDQIREFAEATYPCGIPCGWRIRQEGDPFLDGTPERVACAKRPGFVHIMLDA